MVMRAEVLMQCVVCRRGAFKVVSLCVSVLHASTDVQSQLVNALGVSSGPEVHCHKLYVLWIDMAHSCSQYVANTLTKCIGRVA